ncbi:putative reverse transcriptase domain-containing protein [Tanacetum coccineum]
MTRSSTNELLTPYKEPEQEVQSSRRHFKILSLDDLRSPDFNLLSDQEYSKEEVTETMEQYMSKTRADYGSGVARPKIKGNDNFELKCQFLKELRTNTFSGSDHEDANEHIEKVLEIVDLFHIPNITIDQVMLRAFPMSLTGAARGGYREAASGFYQRNNANPSYQEQRKSMEDTLSKFMSESAKRHEENSNLIKEIRASTDATIRNQGASIKTLEIQIGQMSKKGSYGPQFSEAYSEASQSIPRKEKDLGSELAHSKLTVKLADRTVKYPKEIAENMLVSIGKFVFPVDFIILDMPEDIKVLMILGRPFLSTAHAKIEVYKRKITLRVGEERVSFTSVKPASSLIKRVYILSLREILKLDLEARLMGETLVLNRSLDPFFEDYIELNDLNESFELRRNQGDDLMPTIEEGEVIEEFRTRDDKFHTKIDAYPNDCDYDKKIHIDCAHNLKFSGMIGFEFTHANFFPLVYVNVMSKKFHNSIMKDKMVYKGNDVIGALMNVPIFVGTFSIVTDFAVLENIDAYRDERMGNVTFGESFLREVGIKARRFNGMIAI